MVARLRDNRHPGVIARLANKRYAAQCAGRRKNGFNTHVGTKDQWVHRAENAQKRFGGAEQWAKDVRQLMNMDSLNATITSELAKFKLESLQDYKII